MAIFPNVTGQLNGPYQPVAQPVNIEAWTEQATEALNAVSLSSSAGIRGTSVSLAISLDEQAAAKGTTSAKDEHAPDTSAAYRPRREPLRRDSLKRREALLKGKEGTAPATMGERFVSLRARHSVVMLTTALVLDRLLNNPWAQPPLPSDWEVQPTYRKHTVPYYLAPLWDAHVANRKGAEAKEREAQMKRSKATVGNGKVPKELREKLKKTKAAKCLLQDLEEQVRNFVKQWKEKNKKPTPAPKPELDLDDEEIVFVGRNGQMHDVPQSPHAVRDDFDEEDIQREKLLFDSLADDHGASFGYVRYSFAL